jgi:Ca-activated chloride channel family protein
MNRTGVFLAITGALALIAVLSGVPRGAEPPAPTEPRPPSAAEGSLTMTARLSHPFVAAGPQDVFVTVDVQAAEQPGARRAAVNLALVIDRSGSMSGFKLEQARQAARQLIAQLRPDDRLTLVHYGSDVAALPGLLVTPENAPRLLAFVDEIRDEGGTNIGEGLARARELLAAARGAFRVNRLILISDGQPTEGVTDLPGLTALVRAARVDGVSVSSIGVGEDFNEQLMEALAEVGAGAYGYLQDASQLSRIFQRDLNAAGTQVARGVTLRLRVPAGARLQRVLGYSQVTHGRDGDAELVTVSLPDFAAGQQERVVAQLTVDAAGPGLTVAVSDLELGYADLRSDRRVASSAHLTATSTDSADTVAQRRDKDAVVFAARARAAENSQRAAQLLSAGDAEGARGLFSLNEGIFDEAAAVAGERVVAGDIAAQQAQARQVDGAATQAERKAAAKSFRTKARADYGLMGSTY